jgi:hypothetical protein
MGQTLNGNVDTSATNGFTPGSCDQTGPGWPANMVGAWATQRAEWIALMAKNGFPGADPKNLNGLGGPMQSPTNIISNPGKAVEAPNAETSLVKNSDGSVVGRMTGTSVVFNLPSPVLNNPSDAGFVDPTHGGTTVTGAPVVATKLTVAGVRFANPS